ncbi:MAG: UDP-N-acetylmuramoyl-L-alanine--D-glutamate ligase [Planctomycetes bacterium]|nr:UDP-N-acetylmuramoyl-L-alanine--D-glutamate ligase [Planctomycetota bacterium]
MDVVQYAVRAGGCVLVTDKATPEQLRDSLDQVSGLPDVEFHLGRHEAEDFAAADVVIVNPAVPPDNEYVEIAHRHGRTITSQMGLFFQACPAPIIGITGANGKSTTTTLTAHILERARDVGCVPPGMVGGSDKAVGFAQALPMAEERAHRQAPKTPLAAATPSSDAGEDGAWYAPYEKVWLSGNIGDRPLLTLLDRIGPRDLVVLEISSFQIEQLMAIQKAPQVALLTNLTPNHLDRYGVFEAYCAAKEGLFQFQPLDTRTPAISIFNAEDDVGRSWYQKYRGQPGRECLTFSADDVSQELRAVYALPGRANLSNLAAARAIARCFGVSDASIRACLPDFKALPHRLELVGEIGGVRWYNDSKATTPEGTMVALSAFECPKILIAGGYDKHTPFDELGRRIAAEAKAAILIGQTAGQIADAIRVACEKRGHSPFPARDGSSGQPAGEKAECPLFSPDVRMAGSLAEAVALARQLAAPGDVVLLSPACASYDMFENYQQRGRLFAELVNELSR